MARVFVSGSSTGLGLLAGKELLALGHDVVFHVRNAARAEDLRRETPTGPHHHCGRHQHHQRHLGHRGSGQRAPGRWMPSSTMRVSVMVLHLKRTSDGFPDILAVNVLAPYILTAVLSRPKRLVYLSSGMHRVEPHLDDALWQTRRWDGSLAYSESKLYVTALCFAMARLWPDVPSNAVDLGWAPTRMGGPGAPDDLSKGCCDPSRTGYVRRQPALPSHGPVPASHGTTGAEQGCPRRSVPGQAAGPVPRITGIAL